MRRIFPVAIGAQDLQPRILALSWYFWSAIEVELHRWNPGGTKATDPTLGPEGLFCELTPIIHLGTFSCDRCAVAALGVVFPVNCFPQAADFGSAL